MRKIKKYVKRQGSKKQKERLLAINNFQDEIAKYYYNEKFKNKNIFYSLLNNKYFYCMDITFVQKVYSIFFIN